MNDAVVYPEMKDARYPGWVFSGVATAGTFLEGTVLERGGGSHPRAMRFALPPTDVLESRDAEPVRTLTGSAAIFMGRVDDMYGHFILESLSRLWYARRHPDLPLLWVVDDLGDRTFVKTPALRTYQHAILATLRVPNPVVLAHRPHLVGELHVPDTGYRMDNFFHPDQAAALATYRGPEQEDDLKVWLSRGLVSRRSRSLTDGSVERRLAAEGWTVAHPETLPLPDQLDLLARAARVAGPEGSAFHTLALLSTEHDRRPKEIELFVRHEREHGAFTQLFDVREMNVRRHVLQNDLVLRQVGAEVEKLSPNASETLNALQVAVRPERFDRPDAALAGAVRAALAGCGPKAAYLEVGFPDGQMVVHAGAWKRTAVCTEFAFDPRAVELEPLSADERELRFFEMSAELFCLHYRSCGPYDVVRIKAADGDVSKALKQAAHLANARTTWVIHHDGASRAAVENFAGERRLVLRDVTTGDGTSFAVLSAPPPPGAKDTAARPREKSSLGPTTSRLPSPPRDTAMQAADPRTTHAWTRTASWARDDQNLAELVPLLERLEDLSPDQALRDRLQELTGSSPGRYLAFTAIQAVMDGGGRLPEAWLTAQRLAEYEAWRAAERLDRRAVEITRDWALGCEDRFVGGVDVTTGLGTSLTQGVLRILRREEADAGD